MGQRAWHLLGTWLIISVAMTCIRISLTVLVICLFPSLDLGPLKGPAVCLPSCLLSWCMALFPFSDACVFDNFRGQLD